MDKIDPGPGYRLLVEGEIIPEGYDYLKEGGSWRRTGRIAGAIYSEKRHGPCRTLAQALDAGIQATVQDAAPQWGKPSKEALQASDAALLELARDACHMGPPKESYTLSEVRGAQLIGVQEQDDGLPTYNNAMTHGTIPTSHNWHPKPFTPNKYTRDLLSLDGRRVPVDVYSVLAAFPSNNGAVDHALKKLLAPGQRGQKDRLQDLKEARASLDRAIQMEGG